MDWIYVGLNNNHKQAAQHSTHAFPIKKSSSDFFNGPLKFQSILRPTSCIDMNATLSYLRVGGNLVQWSICEPRLSKNEWSWRVSIVTEGAGKCLLQMSSHLFFLIEGSNDFPPIHVFRAL